MVKQSIKFIKSLNIIVIVFLLSINVSAFDCNDFQNRKITRVELFGLDKTKNIVVLRELKNTPGKVFSCENWEDEKRQLQGLDVFSDISLEVTLDSVRNLESDSSQSEIVVLNYKFKEMFSWMLLPAGKTSDQDGIMLGLSIFNLNFLGQDIRIEAQARTSINPFFSSNEYMLQATSPWLGVWPLEYEVVAVRTNSWNSLKEFNEDSWWEKLQLQYRFTNNLALLMAVEGLMVKHDKKYQAPSTGLDWLSSGEWDVNSYFAGGLIWNNLDSRTNPHQGVRQELRVGYGGIDSRYWEFLSDFRGWYTLAQKNIFHLSLLAQYRPGLDAFYMYYNVGGANSLRGHVPDPNITAPNEFLGSFEYRFEFFERKKVNISKLEAVWGLQAVLGVDVAYLWDENLNQKLWGVFAGVHLLIPGLDRLRFEYGFSDKEIKGTFSFAMFEKSTTQRWRAR